VTQTLEFTGQKRSPEFIKFMQEEQRREAEKMTALTAPVVEAHRKLHAAKRQAWKTPLEQLKKADDYWFEANYADLNLPEAAGSQTTQTIKAAYREWFDTLPSRTGFVIDLAGSQRFQLFIQTQLHFGNIAVTVSSLQTMFDYLVNGDCFAESELGFDPSLKVVQPETQQAKRPTFDELRATEDSSSSRAAEQRLREAAELAADNEFEGLAMSWFSSLQTQFGYTPTDEQWKYIFNPYHGLFVRMNWSLGDPKNYDAARRAMVRSGRFPSTLLTAGEVIDDDYRVGKMTWSDYNVALQSLTRRGLVNRPRAEAGI
jgi:hypothetical protein